MRTKAIAYKSQTINLSVDLHSGSAPSLDGNPLTVRFLNTLSIDIDGDADTVKVWDDVQDAGLLSKIDEAVLQAQNFIDSLDTIDGSLLSSGFS